jgi:hypothetical protein
VFLASFYMIGDAAQWFALLEKNQGTPTWDEFEKLVNQRFGLPIRGNALGELIQLWRETTVADCQIRFLALVNHCKGLTEPHQINIFTAGLHETTLEEAMALVRTYEHCLTMVTDTPTRSGSRQAFNRTKQLALPAPPAATGGTTAMTTTPVSEPCFKRLTAAEMAAKRAQGEFYNCTEKFTKEHLEVCHVKAIFLLEMEMPAATDLLDDTTPQISLNAITGISTAETMKLFIRLDVDTVTTLVDSGSMHSFISTEAACRLHLEPVYRLGLQVTMANDDKVASTGVCHNVQFYIDREAFVMDFFIIPLVGFEMVLDVQWLRTLGPILGDFANARMSCWRDDHCVDWHGVAAPGAAAAVHALASTDLMSTLLHDFEDVFTIPIGLPLPR